MPAFHNDRAPFEVAGGDLAHVDFGLVR